MSDSARRTDQLTSHVQQRQQQQQQEERNRRLTQFANLKSTPPQLLLPPPPDPKLLQAGKVGDTTCPCKDTPPPDPLIEETFTVWDIEGKGNRYWDEATHTLHIVQTEYTDTVVLQYTGPTPPTEMEVYCNDKHKASLGPGCDWKYNLTYTTGTDPYKGWGKAVMPLREIATFSAVVNTWKFRSDRFTVTVMVYNPDQWTLKIKSPPRYKGQKLSERWSDGDTKYHRTTSSVESTTKTYGEIKGKNTTLTGTSRDGTQSVSVTNASGSVTNNGQKTEVTSTRLEARSSQIADIVYNNKDGSYIIGQVKTDTQASATSLSAKSSTVSDTKAFLPAKEYVSLTRNTTRQQVRALDFIGGALAVMAAMQHIKKSIQNTVPEIGWSWDVEFTVLEGEVTFTWGWQEHTDHRVFYEIGVGISMTVLAVTGKIGIGIKSWLFQGQVVLEAEGSIEASAGPAQLKLGLDSALPEEQKIADVNGKIKVSIYIAVRAGDVASVKGGGRSTLIDFNGALKWSRTDNFNLSGTTMFKGVELFATVKVKYRPSYDTSFEVIKPRELGSFQFPRKANPNTDDYTASTAIAAAVKSGFETSFWSWNDPDFYDTITYNKPSKTLFRRKETTKQVTEKIKIPRDNIYATIAQRIWERRDRLELTKETVEGLIYGIRADITQDGGSIELSKLNEYLSSAKFTTRLKDAECPVKCTMIDHGLT